MMVANVHCLYILFVYLSNYQLIIFSVVNIINTALAILIETVINITLIHKRCFYECNVTH
jgi:hypothetical protein